MYVLCSVTALLVLGAVRSDNSTVSEDICLAEGPWSAALEEWATAPTHNERHGRIMALPPTQGYYVTDRVDRPPPPPHYPHPHHPPPYMGPPPPPPATPGQSPGSPVTGEPNAKGSQNQYYEEWHASPPPPVSPGKIVNRPPLPNKDKFRPSPEYQSPPPHQEIPTHHPSHHDPPHHPPHHSQNPHRGPGPVDRVDDRSSPPQKQVSETDLYLLSAIEKLVYRVDLMEKRLRKMEESVHYLVAGVDRKPDPCVENFTRIGDACYHFSSATSDWKSANLQCRKLRSNLLELGSDEEKRRFTAAMLGDKRIKGMDIWTGGLNPGLLWIWASSARPVISNTTQNVTIVGEGRCLALVYDPAVKSYVYRGQDCGLAHRFVCEKEEDKSKLSNEIERVARQLKEKVASRARKARIAAWSDPGEDTKE